MTANFDLSRSLLVFFGFFVALTMREAFRAWTARRLGDRSADLAQHVTINPVPHVDLFGTLIIPLIFILMPMQIPLVFGWAKRPPINPYAFRDSQKGMFIVSAAGVGSNFAIAIVCGLIAKFITPGAPLFMEGAMLRENLGTAILMYVAAQNIFIGLLNLLPFPASDGWVILTNFLKRETVDRLEASAPMLNLVLMALLFMGILSPLFRVALQLFSAVLGIPLL